MMRAAVVSMLAAAAAALHCEPIADFSAHGTHATLLNGGISYSTAGVVSVTDGCLVASGDTVATVNFPVTDDITIVRIEGDLPSDVTLQGTGDEITSGSGIQVGKIARAFKYHEVPFYFASAHRAKLSLAAGNKVCRIQVCSLAKTRATQYLEIPKVAVATTKTYTSSITEYQTNYDGVPTTTWGGTTTFYVNHILTSSYTRTIYTDFEDVAPTNVIAFASLSGTSTAWTTATVTATVTSVAGSTTTYETTSTKHYTSWITSPTLSTLVLAFSVSTRMDGDW